MYVIYVCLFWMTTFFFAETLFILGAFLLFYLEILRLGNLFHTQNFIYDRYNQYGRRSQIRGRPLG
jgi:hypothetical protein